MCGCNSSYIGYVPTSPRAGSKRQSLEHQSTSDTSGINEMLGVVDENIGKDWKQLGTSLGIKAAQIDKYPIDHPNDVREQIYQMLRDWVWKQTSQKEAEDGLIETLVKLGRADIVQMLPGKSNHTLLLLLFVSREHSVVAPWLNFTSENCQRHLSFNSK